MAEQNVAEIFGSDGDFKVSTETGLPDPERESYHLVTRVDWEEWRRTYPGEDPAGMALDILDVGYWYDTGTARGYEPPCEDWRGEFADHRRRIECEHVGPPGGVCMRCGEEVRT